jgi:hypothetical protein
VTDKPPWPLVLGTFALYGAAATVIDAITLTWLGLLVFIILTPPPPGEYDSP